MAAYFRLFLVLLFGLSLGFVLLQAKRMTDLPHAKPLQNAETMTEPAAENELQIGVPAKISVEKPKPARNAGGDLITAPLESSAPLERVEARAQPTPPPLPKPIEPPKPKNRERWRLVYNAVSTSAGIFRTNDIAMILPGIDVVSADEKCTLADGEIWPCGMVARTSFRNFINGRALTCKLPDIPQEKSLEVDCRLRGRDLAEWLVQQGWARAKIDGPYLDQQKSAEQSRLGIFGDPLQGIAKIAP